MNNSEFKKLVDELINLNESIKSFSDYLLANPLQTSDEVIAKFKELSQRFQKLQALIHLEHDDGKTFSKTIQINRAILNLRGEEEDFFEEYEYLHKKYHKNSRKMTRSERRRYLQLTGKLYVESRATKFLSHNTIPKKK